MEERYIRNRIYVRKEEQQKIRNYKILLGGAGIGSIIAECALRFGFESITIVDGDKVELSNLNRQNYTEKDLGSYKAQSLAERLLTINSSANIEYHTCYITNENVEQLISDHDVAINALDFTTDIPFVFDEMCKQYTIPVLHPYNLGWAGFLTLVTPDGVQLQSISDSPEGFELKLVEYVTRYLSFWGNKEEWLEKVIQDYKNENGIQPPPQLSIASWIAAGHCVNVMYNLATGKEVKKFPKFYLSSILNDNI